tara:strand:- start:402600 stop:403376 length:777 start_codon:yes stop_codon:yes gene_type:complete
MSDQQTDTQPTVATPQPPLPEPAKQDQIIAAFVKAQSEIEGVGKNKVAKGTKFDYDYTNIDSILTAIRPVLAAHGLAVSFNLLTKPQAINIRLTLFHTSGQSMSWDGFDMPVNTTDPQSIGSVVTYGKRYQLAAALGIPLEDDVDDDGKRGSPKRTPPPRGSQATAERVQTTADTLGATAAGEIKRELDELGASPDELREAMKKGGKLPAAIVDGNPEDWPREWGARVRKWLDARKAKNKSDEKAATETEQVDEGGEG